MFKRKELSLNIRNALSVTIEEKQSLVNIRDDSKKVMGVLEMEKTKAIKFIQTYQLEAKNNGGLLEYLTNKLLPMLEKEGSNI